jgi:serine/threonine-protein kinase
MNETPTPGGPGQESVDRTSSGLTSLLGPDALPPVGDSILASLSPSLPTMPRVQLREPDGVPVAPAVRVSPETPAGRYQLLAEIARGGMGAVLRGRDNDLGRDVAVKVLLEDYHQKAELAQRFLEEAQIGGQLQHPGVVPVYELGQLPDRRPYFTMKLVKGKTLAEWLKQRASPDQERPRLLKVFEKVCETLAYAHARGVIHRDLKPANIMVGAFGEVLVMDWGLSKIITDDGLARRGCPPAETTSVIRTSRSDSSLDSVKTQVGSVMGTPAYMPPEQAAGNVDRLDARCDVFGLGAILCEILTGKPPYTGADTLQILQKAVRGDLSAALERLEGCGADPELIRLTRRCLAPEPASRPPDAGALTAELTAYLESVEARLRQAELDGAEARARAAEERKRRKLTLALAASVLLTVLLAGSGWLWLSQTEAAREREALARQAETGRQIHDALARAESLRQEARGGDAPDKWAEARALGKRAEALLENGPVDANLAERVRVLVRALDEEEADRQLLARIEQIQLEKAEADSSTARFAEQRALPAYARAFADHGWHAGETPVEDAAEQLRRRPPAVCDALVAALDDWLVIARHFKAREADWLYRVTEAVDRDPWRHQFRVALARMDQKALLRLADAKEVARQPARTMLLLARTFRFHSLRRTVELLRPAQERFPGDFWINLELASALFDSLRFTHQDPANYDEPIRFATAALALRPTNSRLHAMLGLTLSLRGKHAAAVAAFEKAIALEPSAATYNGLGFALEAQGRLDEAADAFHKAAALRPDLPAALGNLATIYWQQGRLDAAVAACRRTAALQFDKSVTPIVYMNLSVMLLEECRANEAGACARIAVALLPDLGTVLLPIERIASGGSEQVAVAAQGVIAKSPGEPLPFFVLAFARRVQGKFAEAAEAARRGQAAAKKTPSFAVVPATRWAREFERCADLDARLKEYLEGKARPQDETERRLLGDVLVIRKQYAAAARLLAEKLPSEPALAENLSPEKYYRAGHLAVLAGGGSDAAKLDDKDRTRWRKQALEWLRTARVLWEKRTERGSASERAEAREQMRWWQQEPDLATVRDAPALAKLPEAERQAWHLVWAEIERLRQHLVAQVEPAKTAKQ